MQMEKPEQNVQSVLCMACLCLDRSLNELQNVKLKQYYLDTLGEIPLCNKTLISPVVCWECEALLKKVLSFREQVKDSYRILQTYAHENLYECLLNDVARPPRLKVHINKPVDISPDISSDNEEEESIKAEVKTEVNEVPATHLMKNSVKLNASQHNVNEQAQVLSDTKKVKKKIKKQLKNIITSRENSRPPRLKTKLNNSTEICSLEVNGDKHVILDIKFEEKNCKEERINTDVDCPNNTDSDPILDTSDNSNTTMEQEFNNILKNKKNTTKTMVKNKLKNAKKIVKRVHSSQKRKKCTDSSENSRPPRLKGSFNNSTDICPLGLNDDKPIILDVKFEEKDYKEERINSDVDCPDNTDDDPILDTSHNCNTAMGQEVENILEMKNIPTKTMVKNKLKNAKKIVKRLHSSQKSKQLEKESQNEKILTIELTYDEMLQERERESKRDIYTKAQYKCETCLIGFHYNKSYKAHLVAKHSPDIGDYSCPICKTIISSVESFTAHYKRHMRRYECSICRKRTIDVKAMQQHYYSTHEISLKEYKCNLCGKISNSIDTHRYHKDTHKARVQCDECDKTFSHRAGLMNHRLSVHEFQNVFPCTVCNKVFRWKTSLKRHLEKHDIKSKSLAATAATAGGAFCAECDVGFASLCSLQRHLRNSLKHVTPDQLKFICDHCNRRFADKTKLRDHIEGKHLHRTYQCHICHKTSKNRVGLEQHVRNVHKGRPNNKMCHHCGKGFPTKVQLESHIRTHTGERPFICEYCPTTFSQQSNLYKHHRQVHLNIKSKRYPLCTKKKMIEGSRTDNPPQSEHPVITGTYSVYYA